MTITDLDQLTFELERFEWRGDDRLEVTGRWYGLRGQRFVRPTLHVREGTRRRRMIALMDHKPWPAEENITWIAAFTYRGDHDAITAARLEVAPDITLELPLPGTATPGTTLAPRPRRAEKARTDAEAAAAERAATAPEDSPAATPSPAAAPSSPAAAAETSPAPADSSRDSALDDDLVARAGLEFAMLAMERELDEERGERARLSAELELARRQLDTAAAHQASAVERANELVRLEGELSAAIARADELAAALELAERGRVAAAEEDASRTAELAAANARADDAVAALEQATPASTDAELVAALERAEAARAAAVARVEELERATHGPSDAELAAALERTEEARAAAVARADEATAALERQEHLEPAAPGEARRRVRPLPRRVRPRAAGHRQWGLGMRLSVLAAVIALLVVLLVILT